jgi:hypothetical protein
VSTSDRVITRQAGFAAAMGEKSYECSRERTNARANDRLVARNDQMVEQTYKTPREMNETRANERNLARFARMARQKNVWLDQTIKSREQTIESRGETIK